MSPLTPLAHRAVASEHSEVTAQFEKTVQLFLNALPYERPASDYFTTLLLAAEAAIVKRALNQFRGNQLQAALALNINRQTIAKLIRKHRIDITEFKPLRFPKCDPSTSATAS